MRNVLRAIEFIVKAHLSSVATAPGAWVQAGGHEHTGRAQEQDRAHENDTYRIFNRVSCGIVTQIA
jgi:hypothetical protein